MNRIGDKGDPYNTLALIENGSDSSLLKIRVADRSARYNRV